MRPFRRTLALSASALLLAVCTSISRTTPPEAPSPRAESWQEVETWQTAKVALRT